ncbi:MAG: 1-deoxy-D-xylulose-5-phosphate reductoisomerase [Verrucomicrobia bacterium]|nr:1-deoxy-D-xylulose-5-phosphate reductoisomerase [Verrucomicrobiota bacterium]
MKNVVLLGSTGSIGTSTVKVAEDLPDRIRLIGLAAGNNAELLLEQTRRWRPEAISLHDSGKAAELQAMLGTRTRVHTGAQGLIELATLPAADIVLIAIVGTAGLQPALAAIRAGKDIAIASKEILVMAGEIVMAEARRQGVRVLAVDSEHSAIFQCLDGKPTRSVRRLWLTASGGPFRTLPQADFGGITVAQALKHPSWVMGTKITIDSATLFNKALEMIEARWLFNIEMARVAVVVHPQSVVHSMVEFVDGSIVAQMSTPDMCLPIQYALTYPERVASDRVQTDFAQIGSLTFEPPDLARFPALGLARRAGELGGTLPAVLNAANEIAVAAFCEGRLSFPQIAATVARVMDAHATVPHPTLDQILDADAWARAEAARVAGAPVARILSEAERARSRPPSGSDDPRPTGSLPGFTRDGSPQPPR